MRFDGVLWLMFDMGGTLLDETDAYRRWYENAAAVTGGALSADDIAREYAAGMARYAPTVSRQLAPWGFSGSAASLYPSELDRPYPEAARVLSLLAPRYRLGVIANQAPGAEARLERFGLRRYFNVIVASSEAGVSKPDPGIFLLALERARCAPGQAVMIGDRPDNDIFPAKRLGMRAVRVRQGFASVQEPRSLEYEADVTVRSLDELPGIFGVI